MTTGLTAEIWGATGSGASTQQHLKSCLIVGVGGEGRVSPLQRLWWGTEHSGVSVTTLHCLVGGRDITMRANV